MNYLSFFRVITCIFLVAFCSMSVNAQLHVNELEVDQEYAIRIGKNAFKVYRVNTVSDSSVVLSAKRTDESLNVPNHLITSIRKPLRTAPSIGLNLFSMNDLIDIDGKDFYPIG